MQSLAASSTVCLLVVYPSERGFRGSRGGDLRESCHWAEMIAARTVAKMSGWEGCALGAAGTWSDSQAQPAGTTDQEAAKGFLAAQEKF